MANVLSGLRSDSHYVAAQRNDPELAEWLAEQPETAQAAWRPPAHEWGLGRELLAATFDRLGDLIAVVINSSGNSSTRASSPSPFPRPVTEIDKARARAEARIEADFVDLIEAAQENWLREQEQLDTQ